MVKMFLQGMAYKEIAAHYGLTPGRIGQILDRQARRANFYKTLIKSQEYHEFVEFYIEKLKRDEVIKISDDANKVIHTMAVNEAKLRMGVEKVAKPTEQVKELNNLLLDYAISLTHLYGLVHNNKVLEIYNMQNDDKVNKEDLAAIIEVAPRELSDNFVEIYADYFVAESILEFDEFDEQLGQRKGKPFYIPEKEELLKYKDDLYFEVNKEYQALLSYITKNIFDGDEYKAEMLCEDVQGICQYGFSVQEVIDPYPF